MNDATEAVGGEPWLAPDAEADGPTSLSSETREVEFDGRRWELPPGLFEGDDPPPRFAGVPDLNGFEAIDWQAWAAVDPAAAAQAWAAYEALAAEAAEHPEGEAERAERLAQTEAELARDIEGWSPALATELAAYGQSKGFTPDELAGVEDAREIKVLHLAMIGEQALAAQQQAQRFGGFRPPHQLGGSGHPGNIPHERQSTEAWMQARQNQLRKKARR